MSALAKAVHRGADGSVHYLSSTDEGSLLIITDPKLGMFKVPFDGPCRLVPRSPSLPASYDAVDYESITAEESTRVTVSPGQEPFLHTMVGVCFSCMGGGHDYGLWPVCPGEKRKPAVDPASDDQESDPLAGSEFSLESDPPVEVETATPTPLRGVRKALKKLSGNGSSEPKPDPEPAPEPVSREVLTAAESIAAAVRRGALSVAELSRGLQPAAFAGYLDYAAAMRWVVVEGDRLRLGPVDNRPAEDSTNLAEIDSPRWGPGWSR